jgi:hypothetical protein
MYQIDHNFHSNSPKPSWIVLLIHLLVSISIAYSIHVVYLSQDQWVPFFKKDSIAAEEISIKF